ncbi:exopolysaccharide biosynthesis polyprenyl glycosylphosphotransferase [Butyrivibrio sp. LC3010]|uniref:exopolysaccharide biosynthesis polyprenyl glycosylphosphotransferase n=1 Tax=Butyrivibrio sp. LC3010 TaxID=1280680 RepID=UPI000423381F|nr:exopolysaccharide biosynthesis polyprenyl glycosylphosphotransferase [Butyrivibrio sp. LC3010]
MKSKRVTHTAKVLTMLWNIGLFAIVWCGFYNLRAFQTFYVLGGIMSVIIYVFIYNGLCNLYNAFRIASSSISEIVLSQGISFGLADLILYIECNLIRNNYTSIIPGAFILLLQITGTILIITLSKRYFMTCVEPAKTMLVLGKWVSMEEAKKFQERILKKYSHLFDFKYIEYEDISPKIFEEKVADCCTVIMYGLSVEQRRIYMQHCIDEHKTFYFTPRIEDIILQGCSTRHLLDTPLMKYDYVYNDKKKLNAKRIFDLCFGLVFALGFAPIMIAIAIAIKIEDGGPVFFKQKRCTLDGEVFNILKFRSMIVDAEKKGLQPTINFDPRITKVGKIIRKYRLDELPQVFNILYGHMSFVGPRPERVEHVELYTKELPEFKYRMKVKAGLTGYAQIFGKYNTSAFDKLRLDLLYIENQSFSLDLRLIMLTVKVMFQGESTEGFEKEMVRLMNRKARRVG